MASKTIEEIIAGHFATALDCVRNEIADILEEWRSDNEVLRKRIETLETELDDLKTKQKKGWFS